MAYFFKPLITLLSLLTLAGAERVGSVTFTPPSGWTVKIEGPAATLTPPGGAARGVILILADQKVTGDTQAWFAATVKQLSNDGQITDQTDTTAGQTASGLPLLMRGVSLN
ncbi:hypothetical protein [Deinococcus marmoris]|uniref:Uncharacterized protein n=1 Tax=Deinococcus marmoris TaxID=249408 RepID=A0A1U7P113_9DEIO|nr:hypothetical protein [Deinococcus marmoris]OLV18865.1 hypothetical protein BOO71_0004558 [Deinococcus marmoris]